MSIVRCCENECQERWSIRFIFISLNWTDSKLNPFMFFTFFSSKRKMTTIMHNINNVRNCIVYYIISKSISGLEKVQIATDQDLGSQTVVFWGLTLDLFSMTMIWWKPASPNEHYAQYVKTACMNHCTTAPTTQSKLIQCMYLKWNWTTGAVVAFLNAIW